MKTSLFFAVVASFLLHLSLAYKYAPCDTVYEAVVTVGPDIVLANTAPAALPRPIAVGDYEILTGDLWTKDVVTYLGFFNMARYVMQQINGEDVRLAKGSLSIKNYGQLSFQGFDRNKDKDLDEDDKLGPKQFLSITGGTELFLGAGGEIECQRKFITDNPLTFQYLITIRPKCHGYPESHPAWP